MERVGFDRVEICDGDTPPQQLKRSEYERLDLRDRVRLLLAGSIKFYKDGVEIPPRQALKG
ncbi:MAG TPA: hypothetical protein VIV11_38650 [Kofleriaceae bacterium]